MKGSSARHLYGYVLFLALAFGQSNSTQPIVGHKYFVRFINNINDKDVFNFRCWSDPDTIGPRELAPNQQWDFGFRLTCGTLFQCTTWYQSSSGGQKHSAYFNGFKAKDVPSYNGVPAIWGARETGMWFMNDQIGQYTLKYPW